MAAIAKVLQNFELVQTILLHTTSYEIVMATSVCTSWRAVVENSKPLRTHIMNVKPCWPPGRRGEDLSPAYEINAWATSVWHFCTVTVNKSCLFIVRDPRANVEIFLLAPVTDSHLKVLDDAYDMYAVSTDFKPNLEFRTKTGEKVCRTKCKALKHDRPYQTTPKNRRCLHLFHMDILRNYIFTFYADHYGPGVRLKYTV